MLLKVGKDTNPGKLAMAIKAEHGKGSVSIRAIGGKAAWQLLKALAISGVVNTMHFDTIKIDDKEIMGVRCDVFCSHSSGTRTESDEKTTNHAGDVPSSSTRPVKESDTALGNALKKAGEKEKKEDKG